MENFFFVVENRIEGEIEKSPKPFRYYGMIYLMMELLVRKFPKKYYLMFSYALPILNIEMPHVGHVPFCCWFAIFHGDSLGTIHFSFVSAFYAVTYYHATSTVLSY